ncbi:MAG: homoserine kinase [Chloroflexi bacterium]|nr:MAG: homoserine kinase [Chloroflexota bacterium]
MRAHRHRPQGSRGGEREGRATGRRGADRRRGRRGARAPESLTVRVTIAVPASIANLGPGFDILAIAVQLQNDVHAELSDGPLSIDPGSGFDSALSNPEHNRITRAYSRACGALNVATDGAHFSCVNRIPFARGLGSSAAAALGGVLAAVALHHAPWDEQMVLDCVEGVEGHRDNAAAALLGGLAICAPGAPAVQMHVPDELRAVVFLPDAELETDAARRVVAGEFSRADAIFNASRCALLIRALAMRDYATLGDAMDDRWHQPARARLIPQAAHLMAAAREAGAAGAALAGAGPSVVALTVRDPAETAAALERAAATVRIAGHAVTLKVRNYGARVDVHA